MDLLRLAVPSVDRIRQYIKDSSLFAAIYEGKTVGALVLSNLDDSTMEIVNVAVQEEFQGKGIGKQLILNAIEYCRSINARRVVIGTGNSSLMQLGLYQKCGFRMYEIWEDHFIRHYEEEIYENGIRCRDMIRLKLEL
ncbi:GNAT family N-acetyltransferase [Cohnella caldifontis]|uniref:GNAT family N-acetyltransferase n=1 Tax=Cohnella caldifontis TaxID=3027471 RepID=UPI003BB61ED1